MASLPAFRNTRYRRSIPQRYMVCLYELFRLMLAESLQLSLNSATRKVVYLEAIVSILDVNLLHVITVQKRLLLL